MEKSFAENFAAEWLSAWNAHDLPLILDHYADDFEMTSPKIAPIAGDSSGVLRGKAAVGAYWEKALKLAPELRFELISILSGVNGITIYYKGVHGRLVAEVFHFNNEKLVQKAFAYYAI